MKEYVICADSACDMGGVRLGEWGVPHASLSFRFTDDNIEYTDRTMETGVFYDRMRNGGIAKTAAVNVEAFKESFIKLVNDGYDVLYLGFSSGDRKSVV